MQRYFRRIEAKKGLPFTNPCPFFGGGGGSSNTLSTKKELTHTKKKRVHQGRESRICFLKCLVYLQVYGAVTELASRVIQDPKVRETLSAMLSASSHKVRDKR